MIYNVQTIIDKIKNDNISVEQLVEMGFTEVDFESLIETLNEKLHNMSGIIIKGGFKPNIRLMDEITSINLFIEDIYKLLNYEKDDDFMNNTNNINNNSFESNKGDDFMNDIKRANLFEELFTHEPYLFTAIEYGSITLQDLIGDYYDEESQDFSYLVDKLTERRTKLVDACESGLLTEQDLCDFKEFINNIDDLVNEMRKFNTDIDTDDDTDDIDTDDDTDTTVQVKSAVQAFAEVFTKAFGNLFWLDDDREECDCGCECDADCTCQDSKDDKDTDTDMNDTDNKSKDFDIITKPSHYVVNGYECKDVMQAIFPKEYYQHFCILNAFKYIWRHTRKNGHQDLEKAKQNLENYIKSVEKSDK